MKILAIGGSSGAPKQIYKILPQLHRDKTAIVILSHADNKEIYTTLKDYFEKSKKEGEPNPVLEITEKTRLEVGKIYVCPGLESNRHKLVPRVIDEEHFIFMEPEILEHHIDHLYTSLAPVYRKSLHALILSGTGDDGLEGSKNIQGHGGKVAVCYFIPEENKENRKEYMRQEFQAKTFSDRDDMPLFVAGHPEGHCDFVGDEKEIVQYLNSDFLEAPQ